MIDLTNLRSLDCQNVGDGLGIFTQATGTIDEILGFKTLIGGPGIILNADDSTLTIEYVGLGGGGAIPFSKIVGAPASISPFGILFGTPDGNLDFIAPPQTSGVALSFNGTGFQWSSMPMGTVTQVNVVAADGINVTGSPITSSGSLEIGLQASGIAAGTYTAPKLTIDAYGRVTAATSMSFGDVTGGTSLGNGIDVYGGKTDGFLQFRTITGSGNTSITTDGDTIVVSSSGVTNVGIIGDADIQVIGSPVSGVGAFALSLVGTGVQPGIYTCPTLLIDANGRITAASSNSIGDRTDAVSLGHGYPVFACKTHTTFAFRSITTAGALAASITDDELNLSVDVGVTQVEVLGGQGVSISGGSITSSGTIGVSLTSTGVLAGTYDRPTITVGSDGRITQIETVEAEAEVSVQGGNGIVVGSGPVFTVSLKPTTVMPGTYSNAAFTIDAFGRVVQVTSLPDVVIPVAPTPDASPLTDTGVVAGTYTNPEITIDAQGRITSAMTVAVEPIMLPATGVAAGRYDNPTLQIGDDGRIISASTSAAALLPTAGDNGDILTKNGSGASWAPPARKVIPKDVPACSQWRLSITQIDPKASGLMSIQNICFRSTVGGTTISIPGTVISDDQGFGTNVPSNAFAKDGTDYVSTAMFSPDGLCNIGLAYETNVVVRDVSITAPTSPTYGAPTMFDVQYCENGVWQTAWSVASQTPWAAGETRSFPSTGGPLDEAFRTLADTPSSYIGAALSHVRVKQSEDGLEFVAEPKLSGEPQERPQYGGDDTGRVFFDLSLGKPIWWTGGEWIDAMGAPIS